MDSIMPESIVLDGHLIEWKKCSKCDGDVFTCANEREEILCAYCDHALEENTRKPKVTISDSLRWEVFERDNFTCKHCGSRRYLSVDHIFPESKGGKATLDNFQTLCRSCNSRKRDKVETT
jgi:hypothetical protein